MSSIRQRSIAQIMLDQVVSDHQLQRVVPQFNHIFALLGSCGITGHMVNHPTIGMTADLEVVHPMELFPFPSLTADYTKQRGLLRQRVVSMDFLKDTFGPKVARNKERMEFYTIKPARLSSSRTPTSTPLVLRWFTRIRRSSGTIQKPIRCKLFGFVSCG